ncbi:hypothetical protein KKG83_04260 [Candidatus Micrarchaeota archaeon]|nr:hypothetical protein [Candidatus Micrarchaeota archaeon]MBU2476658.1 hypothetical protein [Candidatus Micrarchaeota archaeon]
MAETIVISKHKYYFLKKKASFADNVLLQLKASLQDIEQGKVKPAVH